MYFEVRLPVFRIPHLLYRGERRRLEQPELVVHLTKWVFFRSREKDIAEIIRLDRKHSRKTTSTG